METFEEAIVEIKKRTDLGSVIGRDVSLKKSGRMLVGLCPFHNEKTPSFNVNPTEGFYKCFGCGVGGDVFTYLEEKTGQSFIDIAKELAIETGHPLPDDGRSSEQKERHEREKKLYRITDSAQLFFRQRLRMPEGKAGLHYCKEVRGLSDEEIDYFGIGYGGNGETGLFEFLEKQGFSGTDILATGLYVDGEYGRYPFYRQRVTFPIRKKNGKIATFGGRALGDKGPKYVNGMQSPLYDKSRDFYGLFEAMPALKRKEPAVLVEGYFDVIALYKAGHATAVSVCGTALSQRHVDGLAQVTEHVILCLDADAAGKKGMEKALLRLLMGGLSVSQAVLFEKDPDVYIQQGKAKELSLLLDGAEDALDIRIQFAVSKSVGSVRARLDAVESLLPFLAAPRRDFVRKQYLVKAEKWLNIDMCDLEKEVHDNGQRAISAVLGGGRARDFQPSTSRNASKKNGSSQQYAQQYKNDERGFSPHKSTSFSKVASLNSKTSESVFEKAQEKTGESLSFGPVRKTAASFENVNNSPAANLPAANSPTGSVVLAQSSLSAETSLVVQNAARPAAQIPRRIQRRHRMRVEPEWTDAERGLLRALLCYPQLVSQAVILAESLSNQDLATFIQGLDENFVAHPDTAPFFLLQQVKIRGRMVPELFEEIYTHRGTQDASDFMSLESAQKWVNDHVQTLDKAALQSALGEVQRSMQNARERNDDEAWKRLQIHQGQLIDLMATPLRIDPETGEKDDVAAEKNALESGATDPFQMESKLLPASEPDVSAIDEVKNDEGAETISMNPGLGENWTEDFDDDEDEFDF